MKIAYKLTIVCSAMILAAGCRSNQERASRNENPAGSSSYESSATTSSSTTSGQPGEQSFSPSSSQSTASSQSGLSDTDRMLSRQVQQQLQNDPTLAAAAPNIQISAQNGTVILSGNVKSDQEKEKIESTVRSMSGVVSVNNQLQVSLQPTSEPSSKSSRIYSEPSSQSAAVKSDSASQSSVSSPSASQSDTTQSAAIKSDSASQSSVSSPSPSQSDTKDQASAAPASAAPAATEPPTQGSAAADQTQGAKDKTLSPTSDKGNDTSRVYSKDQTDPANSSRTSSQTLDASKANIQASTDADRTLGQQIMSSVQADASLATLAPMIKIKVDSGKVILRGSVKSEQEKQNIEAAVQKVSGVTSVDNRLKVGGQSSSDTSTGTSTDSAKTPETK